MKLSINGITLNVECPQLDYISAQLDTLITKETTIMGMLEDALAKVDLIKTKVDVLNTALDGTRAVVDQMKADLAALQSGEVLSDVVKGKVQAILDSADAAIADVDATYAENFPETPPEEPSV
jgi:hypothetical protein